MKETNPKEEEKSASHELHIVFHLVQKRKGKPFRLPDVQWNYWLFILDGEMNVSYQEFRNHLCKAGEMIFLPQYGGAVCEPFSEMKMLSLEFNNQALIHDELKWEDWVEEANERPFFHKLDIRSPLTVVVESVQFYQQCGLLNPAMELVKEKEAFLALKLFYTRQEAARFLGPLLIRREDDFKAHVTKYCAQARSVEDLASLCSMSPRAFTRKFKNEFNDSPYHWLLRKKAERIKVLLADKKIPLQEIIRDYEFSSPAHFTTYCKKQFGMTPSHYRDALNGKKALEEV
ncbi:MAG: helix-turn-helix transcriptional regulator [Tannerella sp.]|jgi:AraC-like DNA-binding protein|nr:helix-turn-helix transcriptional regulator [Tannerella sp.]